MSKLQEQYEELLGENYDILKENERLRAENAKLRAAGEEVVKWWLSEGAKHFDGAPAVMFNLRAAMGDST